MSHPVSFLTPISGPIVCFVLLYDVNLGGAGLGYLNLLLRGHNLMSKILLMRQQKNKNNKMLPIKVALTSALNIFTKLHKD